MKFKKLLLLPLAALLLAGCNPTPSASETPSEAPTTSTVEVEPVGINISAAGDATTLEIGQTLALTATVLPSGAVQTVTWTTSDEAKATVSAAGVVTGVAAGSVFITATSTVNELVSKQHPLTIVTPPDPVIEPEDIMIKAVGDATSVAVGATLQLGATVLPDGAPQGVTWTSNDTNKATISATGLVTGVAVGDVIITATSTEKATVSETYGLAVTEAEVPGQTEDWENMEYSNHADYVGYPHVPANTPFKIKGKVTHIAPAVNDLVNYYIQNGAEGYYIYGQDTTIFPVELNKSYAVGGFYKNYFGTRELVNVEYFVELAEALSFSVSNISDKNVNDLDEMAPYHASWVAIDLALINATPNIGDGAATVVVLVNEKSLQLRVDPANMSGEEFAAIKAKLNGAAVNTPLSVRGIMSAFGHGTPNNQLQLLFADDINIADLGDEDAVQNALNAIAIKSSVRASENSISLPTSQDGMPGVTISWTSKNTDVIKNDGTVTHLALTTDVTLTATVAKGAKSATRDFVVTVFGSDATKLTTLHTLDLEDAGPLDQNNNSTMKGGYAEGTISSGTPQTQWLLRNALIGATSGDRKVGVFSIRARGAKDLAATARIELVDNNYAFNMLEFDAAIYGNDVTGATLRFEVSSDDGATWTSIDRSITLHNRELEPHRILLNTAGNVRVAMYLVPETGNRVNIDNIKLIQEAR